MPTLFQKYDNLAAVVKNLLPGLQWTAILCVMIALSCRGDEATYPPFDQDSVWTSITIPQGSSIGYLSIAYGDRIYAGGQDAAFHSETFRSADKGMSWQLIGNGLTGVALRGVATGVAGKVYAVADDGIFRSPDSGQTWASCGITHFSFWAVATNSLGHVFASTKGSGVFRSIDDGVSWTQIRTGLGYFNAYVTIVALHDTVLLMGGDGLFRSTDDGTSWLDMDSVGSLGYVFIMAINSTGNIIAAASNGLFISADEGSTWARIRDIACSSLALNSRGQLFVGSHANPGVYRSTDLGTTWMRYGLDSTTVDFLGADAGGMLYALPGYGGWMYRTRRSTTE